MKEIESSDNASDMGKRPEQVQGQETSRNITVSSDLVTSMSLMEETKASGWEIRQVKCRAEGNRHGQVIRTSD